MLLLELKFLLVALLFSQGLDASLVTNATVACPGDVATFTCTVTGSLLTWIVDAPPGSSISRITNAVRSNAPINSPALLGINQDFLFVSTRIPADVGDLRSTLTTASDISPLNGSVVSCNGQDQGPVTIQVADPPTPPQNPILTFQNTTNTSAVTLQWDPPSPTDGVDVSYVVTVSPPPLSESTVTIQTSLVEITVTYNTLYSVTIRAENCVGSSNDTVVMFELVNCLTPSASDPVVLEDIPSVTTEGSTLTISCPGGDSVTSTCESDRRWSPDPTDYDCMIPTSCPIPTNLMEGVIFPVTSRAAGTTVTYQCTEGFVPTGERTATCLNTLMWSPDPGTFVCVHLPTTAPPILCAPPLSPRNGSLGNNPPTSGSPLGTTVTFQCDDGLFPMNVLTATCADDSGNGVWEPDPASLVCRAQPVDCGAPDEPVNGRISDFCNISTIEGSVITFQCNPGLSPEGVMTATCTNDGVWSPDPARVECKQSTSLTISTGAAVGITFTVAIIVGFISGLLVMYLSMSIYYKKHKQVYHLPASSDSQTANITQQIPPAGPVYEEVSAPKEEIELKTNQAYGPVGQ